MYLTRHADYTMRLLIYLAIDDKNTATIRQIARHYGISRNHLVKVAHRAVQTGYVQSVRGRSGGLRLAKPPARIRIGNVLRGTEEDWNLVECFDRSDQPLPHSRRLRVARRFETSSGRLLRGSRPLYAGRHRRTKGPLNPAPEPEKRLKII